MISNKTASSDAGKPATKPLWVYLPGQIEPVLCGRYDRRENEAGVVGAFTYGQSYLERTDRLPIDPIALPLEAKHYETTALNGWFSVLLDAGPDAWGRRLIDRAIGAQDERGYLLNSRGQTAGALAFSDSRDTPPAPAHSTTPQTLEYTLALHARVEAGESLSPEESGHLLGEAGPGGLRPKLTLENDGSLWLVKGISVKDSAELAPVQCVEAALLTLADACNINVPRHSVRRINGNPVLLVERFDRSRLAGGGFGRWRYASARSIFWSNPDVAKYSFQGSYTNLARQLRIWERLPAQSVRELYRRVVFNALVGNTDDHDKNHGVIAGVDGEFILAPAFDLTIPEKLSKRNYLAMSFGAQGSEISLENLLSDCEVFGYTPTQAREIIDEQWKTISSRLLGAIVDNGSPENKAARTVARIPGHTIFDVGLGLSNH
ncbi:MAG: type II toxin-antitoxin system HipA family toxin [Rhodoferax sp.]|uniref:type II toxin-antitoxin system HipA family toxin n=1 Tax=Rhodoferax sp. TaxID=50421 RepID=UPI001824B5B9|nr:HipA domain-containing protein [Rhodoferax sp.]NMM20950.1 type II toxin-antitoxin system HipA family toxin [Rhodoferax sp.]